MQTQLLKKIFQKQKQITHNYKKKYVIINFFFSNILQKGMEGNKKNQFKIEIRRKNIQSKIQALRSIYFSDAITENSSQEGCLDDIGMGSVDVIEKLEELKILSYKKENIGKFLQLGILEKIMLELLKQQISDVQYNNIMNILINVCAYSIITIPNQVMQAIAMNFLAPKRQILSLWLTANIIYQRTEYSYFMAHELVTACQAIEFMQNRFDKKFEREQDIVIFNFFCCSFLVVSGNLPHEYFLRLLEVIRNALLIKELEDENFWYFSEAIVDHGYQIGRSGYEIFGTPMFEKFHEMCRNKKTKYIKNYLKMLINFTSVDKLSYEKMLKYQIFPDLDFCMQNRFPEIKKLCAQIGINLITHQRQKLDIDNIYYFHELSCQFTNFQKHDIQAQIKLLNFSKLFFNLWIQNLMGENIKEKFIEGIHETKAIQALCILLKTSTKYAQIIIECIEILQNLMKIDKNKKIRQICLQNNLLQYLTDVDLPNYQAKNCVEKFLYFFDKNSQ